VYSETHIDLFDCTSGDWLQTLNVKRARPLNISGSLTSCIINDMPYVIYLSNLRQRKYILYITYILNFTFMYHLIFIFLIFIIGLINYYLTLLYIVLGELLNLTPLDTSGRQITRPRRRFSLREGNRTVRPTDRRSKMISAPTNFNHISHMGPGNGIQVHKEFIQRVL